MKKLLFLIMTLGAIMTACKKDDSADQQFEGCQWITEEIEPVFMYPRHRLLMDVGFTKPGVAYYAVVICEGDSNYSEGDIVKTLEKSYAYDSSTGLLSIGPDELKISFINNDMIKAERNPEDITVFSRATKRYNLKNAIDPAGPSEPEELEIRPDTESEWAGGSVQINANRDDVTWSCEVKGHPVDGAPYQNGSLATSISDNGLLTLAMYKKRQVSSGYSITDAVIIVTAKTADGQTATCEVTSKAWAADFYECGDGASPCLYQFNVFDHASWGSYFYQNELMCVQIVDPTDDKSDVTDDDFLSKVNIESVEMNNAGISARGREGNEFQFLVDASSTAGGDFKVKVTYGAFTYTVGPIDVMVL